ncbi:MAG: hypothetical protein OXF84_13730 [Bacteroidetes bacterium]|nr:hypothetical protein [Bacteroidota bacterium]
MQNIIQFHPTTPHDDFGRVALHDMNLERAFLFTAMASAESAATLFSKISNPELFYRPKHQAIFKVIQDQFQQGDTIDPVSILTRVNSPDSTITSEEIMEPDQGDGLVYAASLDYHILILQQLYVLRLLITSMGKNIIRAYDPTTDPVKCLADIDSHIQSLFEEVTRGAAGALSLKEEAKEYVVNLARSEYKSGVQSGIDDLDKQTNGWQSGDLIVLAARLGEGKTSLALTFTLNSMVPTLFFHWRCPVSS